MPLTTGQILHNRYRIVRLLGQGAGLVAGIALLVAVAGCATRGVGDSRLTQTAEVPAGLTSAVPPSPTQAFTRTPSPLPPTASSTATPLPPSPTPTSTLTPTPSPLPPSPTPTLGLGSTQISPLDGMVLMYIPAGAFQMGLDSGESYEQPAHTVTLDGFWIDQTEVTNAMYTRCVDGGYCNPPDSTGSNSRTRYYDDSAYEDYPVVWVDWNMAAAYCEFVGRQLPTEAQWEYAARGGLAGAAYPWGDEWPTCTLGAENGAQYSSCSIPDTLAVGSFAPNGYGLFDMAGNVWEWVVDWYAPYSSDAVENPSGPTGGYDRVMRGSGLNYGGSSLRVSNRYWVDPDLAFRDLGFRCALSP